MAGITSSPAKRAARHRRSPATMVYRLPSGYTMMGCITPDCWIDSASWRSASSSKRLRGCSRLGSMLPRGNSSTAFSMAGESPSSSSALP